MRTISITITLLAALTTVAQADTFTLNAPDGALVTPAPVCGNDALRDRVQRFINNVPVIKIISDQITMAITEGAEQIMPKSVVRDGNRIIAFWKGSGSANYTVAVSIDPSKPSYPTYLSIIEYQPKPCAEKWLGAARKRTK